MSAREEKKRKGPKEEKFLVGAADYESSTSSLRLPLTLEDADPSASWKYFFKTHNNNGKELPYFYDIQVCADELANPPVFKLVMWHGKPGQFMWRNKAKPYRTAKELEKALRKYTKEREKFDTGAFTQASASSRLAIVGPPSAGAKTSKKAEHHNAPAAARSGAPGESKKRQGGADPSAAESAKRQRAENDAGALK